MLKLNKSFWSQEISVSYTGEGRLSSHRLLIRNIYCSYKNWYFIILSKYKRYDFGLILICYTDFFSFLKQNTVLLFTKLLYSILKICCIHLIKKLKLQILLILVDTSHPVKFLVLITYGQYYATQEISDQVY